MSAIHHLKIAREFMDDFVRSHDKYARGTVKFGEYSRKINWILNDMATYPHFRQEVRDAMIMEVEFTKTRLSKTPPTCAVGSSKSLRKLSPIIVMGTDACIGTI